MSNDYNHHADITKKSGIYMELEQKNLNKIRMYIV